VSGVQIDDFLAICETKARYCRCLDEKDWDGYGQVFTEDAVLDSSPSGGTETHGRDALVQIVRQSVETAITAHQVHSPEMTAVDAKTVDVIWAMQDRVLWDEAKAASIGKRGLTGYGHYRERYVRSPDGRWRIAKSVLTRLHMDFDESRPR
jgi:hypothetical protein